MWTPLWGRVIVKPDNIDETDPDLIRAKSFGFELHDTEAKREQHAQVEGTLVAIGGNAFENWIGDLPTVGDRVLFDKYAGFMKKIEGEQYRFINDTDLIAVESQ